MPEKLGAFCVGSPQVGVPPVKFAVTVVVAVRLNDGQGLVVPLQAALPVTDQPEKAEPPVAVAVRGPMDVPGL